MSKKNVAPLVLDLPKDHVSPIELERLLDDSMTPYAVKVLRERALPDIRDGLKPSVRRILVAMHDLKLWPGEKTRKSAKVAGVVVGDYHPHGDAAVYAAMVRMAQPWTLRYPMIDGQGNWGSPHGDDAAAARYTECRLSKLGTPMLKGLSPSVVPHIPNYDGTREEPTVLPSLLPNLIVNGAAGIAVGWATTMAPHNLVETTAAIKAYALSGSLTTDELLALMPGPDFPTGGRILGTAGIRSYYETGRGTITLEGSYETDVDAKGRPCVIVTGLPFGGNAKAFSEQIVELAQAKKIDVADIKSLIAKDTRIIVSAPKGGNVQVLLNQILKLTCLRTRFSVNATVVDGAVIRTNVPMVELIKAFVSHREEVTRKTLGAESAKLRARLHLIEGLKRATQRIDRTIEIVKGAESKEAAASLLMGELIVFTPEQAVAVLDLSLGSLTRLDQGALRKEHEARSEREAWIQDKLGSERKLLSLVVKEQEELARSMGDPRRTTLVRDSSDITYEDLIPEETIAILLTQDNYIKRVPTSAYRVQGRGGKGTQGVKGREDDAASDIFTASTHDHVLFFTNRGVMYRRKGHEIPEGQKGGKGKHLNQLLSLAEGERVVGTISVRTLDQDAFVVTATKGGLVKKTPLREYDSNLRNAGLKAIRLREGDELAFAQLTDGDQDLLVVTAGGKAARYHETAVSPTGRDAQGVKAMALSAGDSIAQVIAFDKTASPDVLVVTSQGYGKKSRADSYRCTAGRDTKGVSTIDSVKADRNGLIVAATTVEEADTLLILTAKGKIIRIPVSAVEAKGRSTMGVRFVDVEKGDAVASIAKAAYSEEDGAEEDVE